MIPKLLGYTRENGLIGFRNIFLLIAATPCVEGILRQLGLESNQVKLIVHRQGCTESRLLVSQLEGLMLNGNVVASHIVTMGCDSLQLNNTVNIVTDQGGNVRLSSFQEIGSIDGLKSVINDHIFDVTPILKGRRTQVKWSDLSIGLKCGGSDYTNGLFTNPYLGKISQRLIEMGAKVVVSEPVELVGVEDQIRECCHSDEVYLPIKKKVEEEADRLQESGTLHSMMVQGNFDGGISTIEEKSSGSFSKFSTCTIVDCIDVGENGVDRVGTTPGVYFQLGTHQEPQAMTLMAAAGAQAVLFATGRGGIFNHPISPMFLYCANETVSRTLGSYIDNNLIVDNEFDSEERLNENIYKISEWLSGNLSISEKLNLDSFDFYSL